MPPMTEHLRQESSIYVSHGDALEKLTAQRYESEAALQDLLATHTELLGGEQIDDDHPRRWLHIGKEVGISDQEGAPDRWSIDHVFIDQDSIPTFVEVKRSTDPRIRREVVGQLIEYVTNAVRHWSSNHLQALAAQAHQSTAVPLDVQLAELVGREDAEHFWSQAEANLRQGRVRLMFVADRIPPELRRMAEFLNDQLTHTEVLAVEVRRYVGPSGISAFVPFVRNATEKAREVKAGATPRRNRWREDDFIASLDAILDVPAREAAKRLYDALRARSTSINYGTGKSPSFSPRLPNIGFGSVLTLWANGSLSMNYGYLQTVGALGPHREWLSQALSPLFGEDVFDPSEVRYPLYSPERWAPHVEVLIARLEEMMGSATVAQTGS